MGFERGDRRGPARDIFGKEGVTYPYGNLDFPVIIEKWNGSPNQTPPDYLSAHPSTTLFPGALLVDQGSDPGNNQNANILLKYEVLPGLWLPFTRWDAELGPIQGQRRVVATAGQVASLSATVKRTYEARGNSSIVSFELVESSGSALGSDFSAYPIGTEDLWDAEKGAYERKTQVVVATGSEVASFSATNPATLTEYVPLAGYQGLLLRKIVETFAYPCPILEDDLFDDERSGVVRTTQLVADTGSAGSLVVSGSTATDIAYQKVQTGLRRKVTTTWPVPGAVRTFNIVGRRGYAASLARARVGVATTPATQSELIDVERVIEGKDRVREDVLTYAAGGSPLVKKSFNRFGGLDVETDKFVAASTVPTNVTYTVQELRQEKEKQARLIETVIATGSAITMIDQIDPHIPGSRATIALSLVLASDAHPDDTATEVYERLEFPGNPLMKIQRKTTYAIPAGFVESRDAGMAYPTLFTSYYSDDIQGTTVKQRGGFSVVVPHLVTHSFGTTRTDVDPYQIIENDLIVFSIHAHGLMDAATATRTVGGTAYTQSVPASSPSKSTYDGLIGSYITVGGGSDIWHAGLYHTETITVKLQ